jgi:glycosyltransferase involved in cell wall biosynthesis
VNQRIERIAVLIPAYNAGKTLDTLLVRLSPYVSPGSVLVVNDGSTDETARIARERGVRVHSLNKNCGKGAALQQGFSILKDDQEFDDIITLDADLQHRPEDLVAFTQKKRQTGADIVIGQRSRTGTGMPIHRRLSNAITSYLVSVRTGANVLDSQCGFRLITKNVLTSVSIQSTGFEAETEFLIKAIKQGFAVEFVPIETIYNDEQSHMTNWKTTMNFTRVLFRDY